MAEVNDAIVTLEGVVTETSDDNDQKPSQDNVDGSGKSNASKKIRKKGSVSFKDVPETLTHKVKEKPVDEEALLIAGTLVLDAKSGRNLDYILGEKYVRSYLLYNKFYLRWTLYFCIAFNLILAIFEKPAVPNAALPYWGTMIMEFVCLGFFSFRLSHAFYFQYSKVFLKDAKNIVVLVVIILTLIDMIGYIVWTNVAPDSHPVRWSRALRPLFIINFPDGKQIRRAFRNIRRTVPDILNVLVVFLLSVLLFGLLALKLFQKRNISYPSGEPYFSNYFDSIWDLYVLVTTANNPDVMMPAYDKSKWFAIFFVVYLILCLYIFMSIVLATIYNNYKKNLKNEIREAVYLKRQKLAKAFDLIKVKRGSEDVVTHSRWKQLASVILPGKSDTLIDLLMKILDQDNNNVLNKKDFLNLSDLLQVQLTEVKDRLTLLEKHFPSVYNHRVSEYFKYVVRHRVFRYFFDFLIVVNAVFIAIDLDVADWFFLSIFAFEILCKLYVLGGKEFISRLWNLFDVFVIGAAFIATIIEKALGNTDKEVNTLDILLVLRVMRLIKIFGSVKRFKVILQTLINIGPSIVTYGGVIFVFYYFFAIIGIEIFHGYINYYGYGSEVKTENLFCGNIKLNNSVFYHEHYCNNNFNDILKALVVMFELTVVNQWHVITSGFVAVTSKAARLYFFSFHLCCVVIVLNIFTAFILEAFILEYTLQTVPKLESVVEAKIKELGLGIGMKTKKKTIQGPSGDQIELVEEEIQPEPDEPDGKPDDGDSDTDSLPDLSKEKGLKFHLKKNSRKKVEVLLQQMFQGELGDDDEGPPNNSDIENYKKKRKLTLEEVT
ncbi:two pore calcium channel protein 1-like [Physella acuta]|uniref:two pore calcium channel protein 1-like n=1 Tax=Physella acuta TaxID=109671 RepID=UPI0027DAEAAD|nr:two pore calcium channel protein 1-like [Physella acuta]XP_059167462.1 two pore calcium channel protein 1-like [Physella acuta]XP_059167463.1 two pore calcium channel protein 1-like [Physella acuta]XP_059167464.1 two pore calcium channel protein 1-like [Physella acuta]